MPHDWEPSSRSYRSNGHLVSRAEVRSQIEKLIEFVSKNAARLAAQYESGDINIGQFETAMRELLKAGHIVAASVGRGGREQMDQSDWGKVGSKIKWQYGYLDKFARKLATGKLEDAYSTHRARSYASALYISYSDGRAAAEREFINSTAEQNTADAKKPQCMLVQNSQEGCEECTADAAEGWIDADDMTEIGGRICGDWCLCEIVFDDEVDAGTEAV